MHKIMIVGIGPGHPSYILPVAFEAVEKADILVGGKRNLAIFGKYNKKEYGFKGNLQEMLMFVKEAKETQKVCILVSGDPGFYSLLDFFVKNIGEKQIEVIPGISSFQYLFAKLKKPWKQHGLYSVHGRDVDIALLLRKNKQLFLLTDKKNSPTAIAQQLLRLHIENVQMVVGENLSYPEERIVQGIPAEIAKQIFEPLSVVVIEQYGMDV